MSWTSTFALCLLLTGLNALHADPGCENLLSEEASLAGLFDHIDATAAELKKLEELTSPVRWRELSAAYGLPALDLPQEMGGKAFKAEQMVAVFEHAGHYALDLRDVVGAGHARVLLQSKEPDVRSIVESVAKGKAYVAIAITEPGAGSDVRSMQSTSEKTQNGYRLTGTKLFNARLTSASHVILFVQSSIAKGKLNAFVLPITHPGLVFTDLEAHGLKGNSFGGVSFENIFVPESLRIGSEGEAGKVFRQHFMYWRLMMAATAIGTGKGALDQVAERLRTRQAFGGPIGRFTHLQQPLAEHTARLHMAALLVAEAAKKIDRGLDAEAAYLAAMAKAEGVEFALASSDFAMKTFGAEGYSTRVDLGQRVLDLMGLRIADGTTDVLRQEVVRKIYGNDLWEMAIGGSGPGGGLGGGGGFGAPPPVSAPPPSYSLRPESSDVLAYLQRRQSLMGNTFAVQTAYDPWIRKGGGGACATVTGFNLLQTLRALAGLELLEPAEVIRESFDTLPELLDGRVTNDQFFSLVNHFHKYLPGLNYQVSVDAAPSAISQLPSSRPDSLQVLIYHVYDGSGAWVGRHFVILKNRNGNQITVVDPHNPAKEFKYELKETLSEGSPQRIELVRESSANSASKPMLLDAVSILLLQ